ncbi:hypothetical protein KF840_00030 [bacterium]|nr:hypothetical protein [bacterium]
MFWYPCTGSIPSAFDWSAGFFTLGLATVALVGAIRIGWLALRAHADPRCEIVPVPFHPRMVDDHEPAVKQAAA